MFKYSVFSCVTEDFELPARLISGALIRSRKRLDLGLNESFRRNSLIISTVI